MSVLRENALDGFVEHGIIDDRRLVGHHTVASHVRRHHRVRRHMVRHVAVVARGGHRVGVQELVEGLRLRAVLTRLTAHRTHIAHDGLDGAVHLHVIKAFLRLLRKCVRHEEARLIDHTIPVCHNVIKVDRIVNAHGRVKVVNSA